MLGLYVCDDLMFVFVSMDVEIVVKKIVYFVVSGGVYVMIEGGDVMFGCLGKFVVYVV